MKIESDSDVQGIAPGQFAIIYSPDRTLCLGSAMISVAENKRRRHKKRIAEVALDNEKLNSNE